MEFSIKGLALAAVLALPEMLSVAFPPKTDNQKIMAGTGYIFIIAKGAGLAASFAILLFSKKGFDLAGIGIFPALMVVSLFFYLVLWMRFFFGGRAYEALDRDFLFIPLPAAVFPSIVLFAASLWLRSAPLAAAAAVYAFGQTGIVLQRKRK